MKTICQADEAQSHMPDYRVRLLHDVLEVSPKDEFLDSYVERSPSNVLGAICLSADAYAKARKVAPTWDVYFLEQEWRMWMNETPKHPDGAFIGFCRKWYEKKGEAR